MPEAPEIKVRLLIHLEQTGTEPAFSWWAVSDELPGFSVAADHLPELLRRAESAIAELAPGAEIEACLVRESDSEPVVEEAPPAPERTAGVGTRQTFAFRELAPAA